MEGGAFPGFAVDADIAGEVVYETLDERQPDSISIALAGGEGFEELIADFRGNSRAGVGDGDHPEGFIPADAQGDFAIVAHGLLGIQHQIHQHLSQGVGVADHFNRLGRWKDGKFRARLLEQLGHQGLEAA